jgi:hypothetical protein
VDVCAFTYSEEGRWGFLYTYIGGKGGEVCIGGKGVEICIGGKGGEVCIGGKGGEICIGRRGKWGILYIMYSIGGECEEVCIW